MDVISFHKYILKKYCIIYFMCYINHNPVAYWHSSSQERTRSCHPTLTLPLSTGAHPAPLFVLSISCVLSSWSRSFHFFIPSLLLRRILRRFFCLPHRRFVLPGSETRFVRSPHPAGTTRRIPITGTTSFRPLPRRGKPAGIMTSTASPIISILRTATCFPVRIRLTASSTASCRSGIVVTTTRTTAVPGFIRPMASRPMVLFFPPTPVATIRIRRRRRVRPMRIGMLHSSIPLRSSPIGSRSHRRRPHRS